MARGAPYSLGRAGQRRAECERAGLDPLAASGCFALSLAFALFPTGRSASKGGRDRDALSIATPSQARGLVLAIGPTDCRRSAESRAGSGRRVRAHGRTRVILHARRGIRGALARVRAPARRGAVRELPARAGRLPASWVSRRIACSRFSIESAESSWIACAGEVCARPEGNLERKRRNCSEFRTVTRASITTSQ
jgi:hypothetical protein